MSTPPAERRLSVAAIAATILVFIVVLLAVPSFSATYDEARYVGVGYSMVEGQGPRTIFGDYFLPHAPVWSTVVVAPAVVLGIDPLIVGRVLNGLCAVGLIATSAALGWRIRPAAGAIAAIGLLATPYLFELTRTSRLDVPSAMLAVGYLALGLLAVRRGTTWLIVAAGLVLGVAFLLKEIVMPLAPVPILAAVLHRQPWRPILWSAGWLTLGATVVVAPWFVFVAQVTDRVYRLGTPAWTLIPIAIALLAVWIAGVVFGRRTEPSTGPDPSVHLTGRSRTWLVAVGTIVWVVSLTLVFAGTLTSRGTDVIDPAQIIRYVQTWYPTLITTGIGAAGLLLAVRAWRDVTPGRREAMEDLALATICGLPLVVLVIGVGEAPRNYLAQLAVGAGLSAAGWLWLFRTGMAGRPRLTLTIVGTAAGAVLGIAAAEDLGSGVARTTFVGALLGLVIGGSAAWLSLKRPRPREDAWLAERSLAAVLMVGLVGATSVTVASVDEGAPSAARTEAVAAVEAWMDLHASEGTTVAFGSYLGFEMGLPLRDTHRLRAVRHVLALGDLESPDGVKMFGRAATDDWIAIDVAPKNVNEFQAFSAGLFIEQLRRSGATFWIYSTGTATAPPSIIPAVEGADGFERVAHWTFARPSGGPIETSIYRLDADALAFDTSTIHIAPDALERLIGLIEAGGAPGASLAARLVDQVQVEPPSDDGRRLVDRLRDLASAARTP